MQKEVTNMGLCFDIGSVSLPSGEKSLYVFSYIEYLVFDFPEMKTSVMGDFIVQNASEEPQCLYLFR